MTSFHATLLREKFELNDSEHSLKDSQDKPLVAVSNRISLPFPVKSKDDGPSKYVIRSHTMQSCLRMARLVISHSPLCHPEKQMDQDLPFDEMWNDVLSQSYSKDPDQNAWGVVYHQGRPVFNEGEYHIFFDLIEKYASQNREAYEKTPGLAEEALRSAGKEIAINHESQIATLISIENESTKCGLIMRSPRHTRTCNITVTPRYTDENHILPALELCADYLEGLHLSFLIGNKETQILNKDINNVTRTKRDIRAYWDIIYKIEKKSRDLEKKVSISYRPERPSFKSIVKDTIEAGRRRG